MDKARVIALRRDLEMSQEEFAKKLGVSWSTVNRWESGKTGPGPQAVRDMQDLAADRGKKIHPILLLRGKDVKFKAKKK